jgi:tousled-like kinase
MNANMFNPYVHANLTIFCSFFCYRNRVDVWSIGVIFFQMLYGKRPFGDGKSQEIVLKTNIMLNAREVQFPNLPTVSEDAKNFIRQCLAYEQTLRPNIAELCKNPYVTGKK